MGPGSKSRRLVLLSADEQPAAPFNGAVRVPCSARFRAGPARHPTRRSPTRRRTCPSIVADVLPALFQVRAIIPLLLLLSPVPARCGDGVGSLQGARLAKGLWAREKGRH